MNSLLNIFIRAFYTMASQPRLNSTFGEPMATPGWKFGFWILRLTQHRFTFVSWKPGPNSIALLFSAQFQPGLEISTLVQSSTRVKANFGVDARLTPGWKLSSVPSPVFNPVSTQHQPLGLSSVWKAPKKMYMYRCAWYRLYEWTILVMLIASLPSVAAFW